jgi:transmembrane sensor
MSERLGHARELGRRVDAGWRREDVEAQLARLHTRQRVRARRRAIAAPVAAAAVTAMVFAAIPALRRDPPAAREVAVGERAVVVEAAPREANSPTPPERAAAVVEGPALAAGALSLGDGSIVTPLDGGRLVARQVSDTDVVVALAGGGARFDVPDRAGRRFRAELGAVAVETRGAAFSVAIGRREVEVRAERGELTARWGRERQAVRAGETRAFAIAGRDGAAGDAGRGAAGDAAGEPTRGAAGDAMRGAVGDAMRGAGDAARPASEPSNAWRDAAARGDYAAAWLALERAAATPRDLASPTDPTGGAALRPTGRAGGVPPARDLASPIGGMSDLLLAGDVARLSGHPAAAVTWLARAAALHPGDPRAPLAAFTLGRVHLEDLGAPRDAAQAFARARELAPDGPLAEDALAREVEAWSRAGETETARARAEAYVRRYPEGHRVHAVRRFGGLEGP